nr:toprim domain-containing protein [Candidatus Bipolaricaulota bacterium]
HLAGIIEAVGGMGTALTERQAQLLARFGNRVILVYDRDAAGDAAALRGMGILRNTGVEVRVARLPAGEDPDSCVRKTGTDGFRGSLEEAIAFQDFFVEALKNRFDVRTSRGKSAALEESKNIFQTLTNIPVREELATRIAELLGLSRDDVRRELDPRGVKRSSVRSSVPHQATWPPSTVLLALVLRSRIPWSRIDDLVSPSVFPPSLRPLAEALADSFEGEIQASSDIIAQLPPEAVPAASELVLRPLPFDEENAKQVEKAVHDALARMVEAPAVERKLGELRQQMADCVAKGDREQLDSLQHRYSLLIVERNRLAKGGKA